MPSQQAMLWDEVNQTAWRCWAPSSPAASSSGSRWPARCRTSPEILCLDEFSIAIDPVTTMKIEDILLRTEAGNDDRAGHEPRAAGAPIWPTVTAFFSDSQLIEVDETEKIFNHGRPTGSPNAIVNGEFRMMPTPCRSPGRRSASRQPARAARSCARAARLAYERSEPVVRRLPGVGGRDAGRSSRGSSRR